MSNNFDIVKLIEKSPNTRLTKEYENKILSKIKKRFSLSHQQLFVSIFYCSLNYHPKNDFVIEFDNIWKWVGLDRRDQSKKILEKFFIQDVDYKIIEKPDPPIYGACANKEKILLNINTYKKFCLKVNTKKSDEIQDLYVKSMDLLLESWTKKAMN